jgi:sarcosine oxidase subunit beta
MSNYRAVSRRAYDAVIIGGGVIGNSCALELARAGRRTLTIDPNSHAGYGSTSSSSSIVRVFYSALDSCKLAWEGYWGWQHWEDYIQPENGEQVASFRRTGGLILKGPHRDLYAERVKHAMETLDIEHELWDLQDLKTRLPYVSTASYDPPRRIEDALFGEATGELAGGLYTKHTGYMDDPQLAARNLADAAKRSGAEFLWQQEVAGLTYDPTGTEIKGVVLGDGSEISAPIVINAAGPHSSSIHRMAFSGKGCQVAACAKDFAFESTRSSCLCNTRNNCECRLVLNC